MVRTWSVGASIGGAALAAVLLSGCGSADDDAAALPSSATSAATLASAEPSSGATPADYVPASLEGPAQNVPKPVMPELAKEESLAGAQAFLDYWSDAMWYAYQTGDTSYARDIISEHCEACIEELDEIERVYDAGQWLTGGRQELEMQESTIYRSADGVYKPVVKYQNDEVKLIDGRGIVDTVPADPNSEQPLQAYLDYVDGSWIYITMAPIAGS